MKASFMNIKPFFHGLALGAVLAKPIADIAHFSNKESEVAPIVGLSKSVVAVYGLIVPAAEELFFRGALQGAEPKLWEKEISRR